MNIQAEVSFYPLRTKALGATLNNFLNQLSESGLQIKTGTMSTQVTGQLTDVFEALSNAFSNVATYSQGVLVVKVSNACPPDMES